MKKLILILTLLIPTLTFAGGWTGPNMVFKPMVKQFGKPYDKILKKLERRHKNDSIAEVRFDQGKQRAIMIVVDHGDWTERQYWLFRGRFLSSYRVVSHHQWHYSIILESYRHHITTHRDTERLAYHQAQTEVDMLLGTTVFDGFYNRSKKFQVSFAAKHNPEPDVDDDFSITVYRPRNVFHVKRSKRAKNDIIAKR